MYVFSNISIADAAFERVLLFGDLPSSNDKAAIDVIGQDGLYRAEDQWLLGPRGVDIYNNQVHVSNTEYNQVVTQSKPSNGLFDDQALQTVVGQWTFAYKDDNCSSYQINAPTASEKVMRDGDEFTLVADQLNNRIMIWKNHTGGYDPAHTLLGQIQTMSCFSESSLTRLAKPSDVWSDGNRIIVSDQGNNRILFWESWPETAFG